MAGTCILLRFDPTLELSRPKHDFVIGMELGLTGAHT